MFVRANGIEYRFRYSISLDSVKLIENGINKLEISERPHLNVELSVPIDGLEPKRWWKDAIVEKPERAEFPLDHSIKAVGGSPETLNASQIDYAYLCCSLKEAQARLDPVLSSYGYFPRPTKGAGMLFYYPKWAMYRVVLLEVRQSGRTLTKIVWYTSMRKYKRRLADPDCS